MVKLSLKKKEKIANDWIRRHGAASFDLKKRDIILHDGGLFSIEAKKIKVHKIVGYKKLPNKMTKIIFSKKKIIPSETYKAVFWFEELDENIYYLKSMKKMLNSLGYGTGRSLKLNNKLVKALRKKILESYIFSCVFFIV